MRKGRDGEKNGEKKEKRLMIIVATTSLPAVDRPNADRWNADRSCQLLIVSPSSASGCSILYNRDILCYPYLHRNYLSRKQKFLLSGRLPRFLLPSQNNNKTVAFLLGESSITTKLLLFSRGMVWKFCRTEWKYTKDSILSRKLLFGM